LGCGLQSNLILALHGFLGRGDDWNAVRTQTEKSAIWITPDLFSNDSTEVQNYQKSVANILSSFQDESLADFKKIFVGYSLGGRLGLHILKTKPDVFDHYIFVSTHPGLENEADRKLRLQNDLQWSEMINNADWGDFLDKWNAQPVFSNLAAEPVRRAADYDIEKLAASMELWSLGAQDDLRDVIKSNQNKITWVVGDADSKFVSISQDLVQKKILLDFNKIFSDHRILNSNPSALAEIILKTL
jgi:2-succinyl-6-hydroxy-2,4-cyclohexadiene-1-carboxylate synthase